MSKQRREEYQDFFLLTVENGVESAQVSNLEAFNTRVSYISAAVTGGKMSVDEAETRIKDLYKVWKRSHKALDNG